jgi:hypothetical protein
VLGFDEAAADAGTVPLYLERSHAAMLFPTASRFLPSVQIAELLATTRLVGMRCPGLHSLYAELDLLFGSNSGATALGYRVDKANRRYSKLELVVEGPTARGRVTTFVRPAPAAQLTSAEAKRRVSPDEFAGQQAIVIGGSRGIGEVTSKLIASGGGRVFIGYRRGRTDAEHVAEEIRGAGGAATTVEIDVLSAPAAWVEHVPRPTHLYYFATPAITPSQGAFSVAAFEQYCRYYVAAFGSVATAWVDGAHTMRILYPSSVYVSSVQPGLAEYAAAKAAGEVLCAYLARKHPQLRFAVPRLPRVKTDQTLSLSPLAAADPAEIMLPLLRDLQA